MATELSLISENRPPSASVGGAMTSVLSAGKKNARRSKNENCIQGPVTQRIMIGAGEEKGRNRTRILTALRKPPRGSTRNAPSRLHGHEGSEPRHDRKQSV